MANAGIKTAASGLNGALTFGGADVVTFDGTGITSGVPLMGGLKNKVYNGAFDVWQRGTSFASTGAAVYTADRWYQFSVTGATVTRVAASSTDAQYGLKLQRNNGQTWTSGNVLEQPYETGDIIKLRGQVVTLSVWIKKGADLSSSASLGVVLKCGTGAEGKYNAASFTGASDVISQTVSGATLSTTLTKYTYTSTAIPTNATQMALYFSLAHSGTAGADDSITIEKVQLEVGSSASTFEQRPYGMELALCQRYTYVMSGAGPLGAGGWYSSTTFLGTTQFPVTMRIAPTLSTSSPTGLVDGNGANYSISAFGTQQSSAYGFEWNLTTAASVANAGGSARLTGGSVILSAEL